MNAEKGESPLKPVVSGRSEDAGADVSPKDWKAALAALISARVEMIRIEAKPASAAMAGRLTLFLIGMFGLFSAWVLALAASIGAIAAGTTWQWYHVAFATAAAHLVIGLVLLLLIKPGKKASFPVTRAEFQKDREWLNRLNNQ